MEHDTLQRRSAATIKNMGVNSYSQIVSAFRAQGDLTDDKLTILPVLQNALGISRERHTAEVKRALYDEQLSDIASSINPSSSSSTMNWEVEANYNCPTVVHRPPNTKYVQLAEHVLQTTSPTTIIQHPQPITKIKLNHDLQQLVHDEVKQDGIINASQQQLNNITKQNFNNFNNTDIQGSKVIRLVRAKQATKRKSSLDTLIEVVQKELRRVNEQTNSISPSSSPPHYSQTRLLPSSKLQNRVLTPHRSIIASILPSSHPGSLTSQSNHSFKIARKRGIINFNNLKQNSSFQQRNKSFNNNDDDDYGDDMEQSTEDIQTGPENIEEIVRETVDKLVAITLLNNAPFIVNMLTAIPGNNNNTNAESQTLSNTLGINNTSMTKSQSTIPRSDYYRNDLALLSSTASDLRNSMQQISPIKQQHHHSQLIIQPATSATPMSTTSTLFVAPRILNFQTVVPKPTTNIQIGNTKIILVSPSNITQHLPHSTTSVTTSQQQTLVNNSSVKLVKFTTTNNNNSIATRTTTLPINSTQTSTLTLPKNVQIVIPSQTSSTKQLTRTHSDDLNKSLPTTATFRPVTTVPMTLTTCSVDQIPQAAQEVTITTSPTSSPPPLSTNTSDLQQQSSLGTTVNVISSNSNNQSANNENSQQQTFLTNSSENNNTDNTNNNNGSTIEKSRRRSSSSASTDRPVGKILRPIAKVLPVYSPNNSNNNHLHATITDNTSSISTIQQSTSNIITTRTSPTHDEMIKSVAVNFQQQQPQQIQRSPATHGPMIYRMTSVNPNVPVFRVRATTAPTSTTVMNKSIKTDAKPISVTTATNMCYEPKPTHNTPTSSGSVSVLACFKTTKKRNKERAIMPRPSANDSNDISQELQQRLNTTPTPTNTSLILNSDIINSNLSPDYHRQSSSTPTRLVQQTSLSSTLSDDNTSNMFSSSMQEQNNDTTTSSSNSIPISRHHPIELTNNFSSIQTITTPNSSPRPLMEDKSIQCINDEHHENSIEQDEIKTINDEQLITNSERKKRSSDDVLSNDESWTVTADSLLRNILSQYGFRFLDVNCQQNLSSKFDLLQANLVSGALSSKDEFYNSVLDIKRTILDNGLSRISEDNLEKLFNYFEIEFPKICDETNEQKRIRRQ